MTTDISLDEEIREYPKASVSAPEIQTVERPQLGASLYRRSLTWVLPLSVFLLALVPRVLGLNVFLTADEDDQLRFAASFLTALLAGDWAKAALLGYPGVPTMAFGGLGLGLRYVLHRWGWVPLPGAGPDLSSTLPYITDYPLDYIQAARLPMALLAALAIVGMYLMMCRLLDRPIALVATLLIAFDPFFLANSRILHVDAPLAYFMLLSFLAFFLYLQKGHWPWLVLSGLFGALATLSKTPGAMLGPILFTTGLIYALFPTEGNSSETQKNFAQPAGVRWRRFAVAIGIWGVVAIAGFYALWPSMWTEPSRAIFWITQNIRNALDTSHPTSGVFWGATKSDQSPLYYLITLPFHLTPLAMVGLLAGIIATWRLGRYQALLLALWAYGIVFITPVSIIGRRGDRYILPVYLALDLIAAISLYWVVKWLASIDWGHLKERWEWALGTVIGIQILFISLYHPYYFDYFNPLVGGGYAAPYLINVGWGEGLDRAAAYLNQVPDVSQKTAAAWYSSQFAPFFKGRTVDLSSNEPALTSDYTVFYINQVQRGFPSEELLHYFEDRHPIHTTRLGSVDYAWIYEGPVISTKAPVEAQHGVDVVFGGAVHLIGYDTPQGTTIHADDVFPITLYWETLAPIQEDYNVYVRLIDDMGTVWGQVDRLPLGGLWRTDDWRPGTYIRDEYQLSLRPGTPPDVYRLEVSMYSYETGETFGIARNIGQVSIMPAHRTPRPQEILMQHALRTSVAPGLELMGYELDKEKVGPGERLPVTLYWRATRPIDRDYQVNLDAKSVAGTEGGGWLDRLASEDYPTSQWRWGEVLVDVHQLQMPPSARSGFYLLSIRLIDAATGDYASDRVILGKLEFVERARSFETPEVQHPVGVDLGSVVQLIGYDLPQEHVAAGGTLPLTLYWRTLDQMDTSYTVFVHVVGPDGVIRGQWDSVPGDNTLPTTGWVKDEVITDHYLVPVDEDAPPWQYTVLVGMYDPITGQRLTLTGAEDRDSIALGLIQGK